MCLRLRLFRGQDSVAVSGVEARLAALVHRWSLLRHRWGVAGACSVR